MLLYGAISNNARGLGEKPAASLVAGEPVAFEGKTSWSSGLIILEESMEYTFHLIKKI